MRVTPPGAMLIGPKAEPVFVEHLALLCIARHPVHRHQWKRVVSRGLLPRSSKDPVDARSHNLIHVELDPDCHSCCNHAPDLVEVEGHRISHARQHLVDQYVGVAGPERRRPKGHVADYHNDWSRGKQRHRPQEVRCHPLKVRVGLTRDVGHEGFFDPFICSPTQIVLRIVAVKINVKKFLNSDISAKFVGCSLQHLLGGLMMTSGSPSDISVARPQVFVGGRAAAQVRPRPRTAAVDPRLSVSTSVAAVWAVQVHAC
mmetsp:Transcript_68273/g.160680  ORF Transcript_68273/g.160680 Transcript_68273/m.160680 type:complete len:258 (+) Transcript_68273:329-1102(+)